MAPRVLGRDPLEIERLTRGLAGYLGYRGSGVETRAVSAFDIALWDLYGKVCGQPLYQVLGGASRESIRTYNTCAGYRYIRDARQQSSANWGLGAKPEGPYEDLDAFLHRPEELAHSLLEQGIGAMKIWPFDTYAEASEGLHISFDLAWCGGISEARRIAALADAWQLPVAPHDCAGPLVFRRVFQATGTRTGRRAAARAMEARRRDRAL